MCHLDSRRPEFKFLLSFVLTNDLSEFIFHSTLVFSSVKKKQEIVYWSGRVLMRILRITWSIWCFLGPGHFKMNDCIIIFIVNIWKRLHPHDSNYHFSSFLRRPHFSGLSVAIKTNRETCIHDISSWICKANHYI